MAKIDVKNEKKVKKVVDDSIRAEVSDKVGEKSFKQKIRHLLRTRKRKVFVAIIFLLLIATILLAVPTTRYGIVGYFVKKDVSIIVKDKATHKPVSQAVITIGTKTAVTTSKGEAKVRGVPVGEYTVRVSKKYYKDDSQTYTVPIIGDVKSFDLQLTATGRQVGVSVTNKVTGSPLAKAIVKVGETSTSTDEKGLATIVLPADKQALSGTVELTGYNKVDIQVKVSDQTDVNKFNITPSGSLYYLSKATGKINVMKSNLDGSDARAVVTATGNENDRETVLLAARDWQFLALSAKRTTNKGGELYLVDAKTDQLKTIDEGNASFQLVGWSGHKFIYIVNRNTTNYWDQKKQTMKSYDADTGKITVLDEQTSIGTNGYDYEVEYIGSPYIQDNKIVYSKSWSRGNTYTVSDKKAAIMTINTDGSSKQRVKEFAVQRSLGIDARLYEPREIYFKVSADNATSSYYEYEDGGLRSITYTDDKFYNSEYSTYLISPNGEKTFWSDPRNGKNTLFIGNKDGKNEKTIVNESEYAAYGWYSDDYILLSRNGSELYIASSSKSLGTQPLKITNYHKPSVSFIGYGSGYGGI